MTNLPGHLAIALLFALPAWIIWDGRASLTLIVLTLTTAMLPDIDLVLQDVLPIAHHGVTHTLVFVVGVSLIAGALVEVLFRSRLERIWLEAENYTLSTGALFAFVATGFALGGSSHLFADLLSAPDIAQPIEPLWPFYAEPIIVDVIWYNSFVWNQGLLLVALVLHAVLAYLDLHVEHPFQISQRT